jgi:transcriptional regulatory protein LevR
VVYLLSKLVVQKEEKFNYQQTKYRIILSETEMFYIFDVFDEDGKPAIIVMEKNNI